MDYLLFPIGDTEAITAEIRLAARQLCARIDQKDLVYLVCKVGPKETRWLLPRRIILDGIIVNVLRESVFPGTIWLGVKED